MTPLMWMGAAAVSSMLLFYWLEPRSPWFSLCFALSCAASSAYGWLAGTWPFGVVEGVWALVAGVRWWRHLNRHSPDPGRAGGPGRG